MALGLYLRRLGGRRTGIIDISLVRLNVEMTSRDERNPGFTTILARNAPLIARFN